MPEAQNVKGAESLILLIEDDENDAFIFRRALGKAGWRGQLRVVGSVNEARAYMEHGSPFQDLSYFRCPDLIISDYRLNTYTATDFIDWLHSQPHLSSTPVVILTGAGSAIPAAQIARIAPAGFLVKTPDVAKLAEVLQPYLP